MPSIESNLQNGFPFLELPLELPQQVYGYTLCSFSLRRDSNTLEEYSHLHAERTIQKRQFLGTINLLLVNKQVYHESF
ncbi:hypothetical protein CC86DRAFT_374015 [Ophiobolus disseminans]|uniref:Uncharacterized protein n=1 Tax=Ophiobolus disseminans TaxID=1469910 RepID=A0A6A6ZJD2_9PLEO|nr:hypothetical protein CC86DRAFT_374015 [Ophiobolus disseminans]